MGALRGRPVALPTGTPVAVTLHPSDVLRADEERKERRADLLTELELARELASGPAQISSSTKS